MSYIRSGENPEGLYIVGTAYQVEIFQKGKEVKYIPHEIFNKLIVKFVENCDEDTSYKGASISDIFRENGLKAVLVYEDWEVEMWWVTWWYIAHLNYDKCKESLKTKS